MFTEQNTVEQMILDTLSGGRAQPHVIGDAKARYQYITWQYLPAESLRRSYSDVFVEEKLRAALIRLNPCIAEEPERAEEVIYKLRAILLSVQADGLVRANEHFTQWLRGEKSMPFGANNEHTVVRLLDFDNPANNEYIVTSQWVYPSKENGHRFDIVRLVRFPGWQTTKGGEREVQRALRKTLLKYKLHKEQELFDKAYGYIRQYY